MQRLKLPKKLRIAGLYLYCNECKKRYSNDSKVNCSHRLVYQAKIHVPNTKDSTRVKVLAASNIDEAITEIQKFKTFLKETNFNSEPDIELQETPILLTDCMAYYIAYLRNENVYEMHRKERTEGHIKDYIRNFKYYINALNKANVNVENLKFIDITKRETNYFHNYITLELKASNRYYNNMISALRIFTDFITREFRLSYNNPFKDVKKKYVKLRNITVNQSLFQRLISVCSFDNGWAEQGSMKERRNRYRTWMVDSFYLSLYTGGRLDEVTNIRWSDIIYDEHGVPMFINSEDYKFNRAHSDIVSEDDKKGKLFVVFKEFREFLQRIGLEEKRHSNDFIIGAESIESRRTIKENMSKGFTHFKRKAGISEKVSWKNLRKTYITQVNKSQGSETAMVTDHDGMDVVRKHYINKDEVKKRAINEIKIYENLEE